MKGQDNGRRFLVISLICYSLVILFHSILNQAAILVVLLTIITSPILTASAIRRVKNANFNVFLAAVPLVIFLVNLYGIIYIENNSKWALLVLALISTLIISTLSHAKIKKNVQYVFGYFGPMNDKPARSTSSQKSRIEPTIAAKNNLTPENLIDQLNNADETVQRFNHNNITWEQQISHWLLNNKKISIIATSVISVMTVIFIIISLMTKKPSDEAIINLEEVKTEFVKERLNKIKMPDQFWIMLDQNDSLSIAWEGDLKTKSDFIDENSYWSASTGLGDKDCVYLHFSLGEDIRTLNVTVKNGGDYYADFSPVDTNIIINSIANKDRFKLCGYEFTLKGTRSLLKQNRKYLEYFSPIQ
jgi:hypothetical protein